MQALQRFIRQELPEINDFLARETEKLPPLVRDVARHVLQAGGKRLRPLLTILFARCRNGAPGNIYPLACAMEFFHSATLLHDDILDDSSLRRGSATAHLVFGKTETILAGDVLLALGSRLVAEYGNPRLSWRVSEAMLRTVAGEIQELEWTKNPTLSQDHYLEIITGKTAYLIQAACHCGAVLAGNSELEPNSLDYGMNLGIAFQLTDDALDYDADPKVTGKPVGGDLREGKLTLPLILFLEKLPESERIGLMQEISTTAAASAMEEPRILEILENVRAAGCVDQTRNRASEYVRKAASSLTGLPDAEERLVLHEALAHILHREK